MNGRMPRTSPSATAHKRAHFVVDGSNIATEGRSQPSLTQLNEAVLAFLDEHPGALITVVVDATFGHRIDKKEVKEFDLAVANNELVTPPAGAVGRGDAFVLSIAHKAKAGILSNDSFQEFHGTYDWLFDTGRLIGGKPVPHVGWVFVERSPVRGPKSRQSVKDAKQGDDGVATSAASPVAGRRSRRSGTPSGSTLANEPMPVPSAPPPGPARGPEPDAPAAVTAAAAAIPARTTVNDLVPFLDFVERHPVGTSCTAVLESYSSHGAYARSDSVLVYIPLRLMDDPPPRSARSRLKLGEAVTLVVVGYAPERRSVDAALPNMAPTIVAPPVESTPARRPRRSKAVATPAAEAAPGVDAAAPGSPLAAEATPAAKQPRKRGGRTKVDAAPAATSAAKPAERPAQPGRRSRKAAAAPVVAESAAAPARTARASKKATAAELPAPAPAAKKSTKRAAKATKPTEPTKPAPETKPAGAKPAARGASRRKASTPDPAGS